MPSLRKKSRATTGGPVGGTMPRNARVLNTAIRRKSVRQSKSRGRVGAESTARTLFPEFDRTGHRFGLGILLAVLEREGSEAEIGFARVGRFHPTPGRRPKAAIFGAVDAGHVARMLAGLAHPDRIRILRAILQGSATHFALHKAVGLKTGPLYHHLRALERAGVLTMATRNAYELTKRGRVALLVTHTLGAVFGGNGRSWTTRRMNWDRS
ncbi:MAG TPA: winged helix-turn-helix domain-containing protein [Phycisphaerae bacterium]|nr:winged helix-turn-helix domain-containing protein [Phycisphaerae bacterium]